MKGRVYNININVHRVHCFSCNVLFINAMIDCINVYEHIPNKYGPREEHFKINSKEVHYLQVSDKQNI